MQRRANCADQSVARGIVSGAIGGLIGSYVMSQFQAGLTKLSQKQTKEQQQGQQQESGDDATVKAASAISESALGHPLTKPEKKKAGPAVHYAFGAVMGAAYGAFAEGWPKFTSAWGMPFGAALWLGADEVVVPAVGLMKQPSEYPLSTHASALAAHLVYAVTVDGVRRAVRTAW